MVTQISGVTAPGELPEIESYQGVVAEGSTLTIRGSGFQEGAYATLNGEKLETKVRDASTMTVELAGIQPGEANRFAVYNPDGGAAVMPRPLRTGKVVEQVLPAELRTVGGEVITLTGYGFTDETAVTFDGSPVEIVELVSGRELKIRTPAGALGRVDLAVRDEQGAFEVEPAVAYAEHPILLSSKEKLDEYRALFKRPDMAEYRKLILKLADLRATPRYNNSKAFLSGSYGNNIYATAWAYLLTGEQKYKNLAMHFIDGTTGPSDMLASLDPTYQAEQAKKKQEAVAAGELVPTAATTAWGAGIPVQVLSMDEFHINRGVGLAYAYDLLFDELSPEVRGRMLTYMQKMVDYHLRRIEENSWWHINNPSNTVTVGNGGAGIIAMTYKSLLDDPEALGKELADNITRVFKGVTPDGGAVEGSLYWNYGFLYQVLFGRALENAFGNDYGMLSDPRLQKSDNFAYASLGGDGNMFVFNDSQPYLAGTIPAAVQAENDRFMRWLVDSIIDRYADEKFPTNETARPFYGISAFLLRGDEPVVETMPPLPTLKVLPITHWAALRSAPDAYKQGVVAGIKGKGGATTHHAQADQGGYVLQAHGERFVIDAGYGYNDAKLHSLPLILEETTNKKGETKIVGRGPHPRVNVPLMDGRERGDIRTVRSDATPAYGTNKGEGKYAEKVKRVYTLVGEEAFVVLDDVLPAESGQNVRFQYQLETKPELNQGERSFALAVNGKQTSAHIFGPESSEMTIEKQSRRKGWIWKRMGLLDYFSVRGEYAPKAQQPLITVFQPTKGLEAAPAPEVEYDGDSITVTLGSGRTLDYERIDGDWVLTTI